MELVLVVHRPRRSAGKEIPIDQSPFVIGRDSACDLSADHATVSRRHCIVELRQGKAFVKDLGSRNGTFINGELIVGERQLHGQDLLQIGPLAVTVQVRAGDAAPQSKDHEDHPADRTSLHLDAEELAGPFDHTPLPGVDPGGTIAGPTIVENPPPENSEPKPGAAGSAP